MVNLAKTPLAFWREERASILTEGLLAFPIFVLLSAAMVEFGSALHQSNQSAKALQIGVRLLAVSSPVVSDFSAMTADYPDVEGGQIPIAPVQLSCGFGDAPCDAEKIARILRGSDGLCDASVQGTIRGICDFLPQIGEENLHVTYHRSGLGFVSFREPPPVIVTLELHNAVMNLPILGAILGRDLFTLPQSSQSRISEDLSDCLGEC